jgi:hypothetical protein
VRLFPNSGHHLDASNDGTALCMSRPDIVCRLISLYLLGLIAQVATTKTFNQQHWLYQGASNAEAGCECGCGCARCIP